MDELLFLSGQDILIPDTNILFHPPTLKEIALMGERNFFLGCGLLNMSKEKFLDSDIDLGMLDNLSDFDILYYLLTTPQLKEGSDLGNYIDGVIILLEIIFANYLINYDNKQIKLYIQEKDKDNIFIGAIDTNNYESFKQVLNISCSLMGDAKKDEYNPAGDLSRDIARKLEEAKKKLSQLKNGGKQEKVNILSKYASIMAIALKQDLDTMLNYTVFQLKDQYDRYLLKMTFDMNMKARLAGAKDVKDGKYWMDDVHEDLHI